MPNENGTATRPTGILSMLAGSFFACAFVYHIMNKNPTKSETFVKEQMPISGLKASDPRCPCAHVLEHLDGGGANLCRMVRIGCIGDSNTSGQGLNKGKTYPALLKSLLRQTSSDTEVQNFGKSRATASRKSEQSYVKSSAFACALEYEADYWVVWLGTNDAKDGEAAADVEAGLRHIIQRLRLLPCSKILLLTPGGNTARIRERLQGDLGEAVQKAAEKEGRCRIVDLYAASLGYQKDHIHLSIEGAASVASMVAKELQREFGAAKAVSRRAATIRKRPLID
jgi:lysophospholipase L1-like esterase